MVGRQVDQPRHGIEIEAVHRAGVQPLAARRQHQRLRQQAAAAHGLVALHLRLTAVVIVDGAGHVILHLLRRAFPDTARIRFPAVELGADHHQHRGLGHLRLVPAHLADLRAQRRIADLDQSHVLQVERDGACRARRSSSSFSSRLSWKSGS